MAIIGSNHSTINTQTTIDAPAQNTAPREGVVARGIGMFQKAYLFVTGGARAAHTEQLRDLKDQVSEKVGEYGLAALNEKLAEKGYDTATSTKLFSTAELSDLVSDAKAGANLRAFEETEASLAEHNT
ncbi:hypothetical protein LPB41_14065 [Thalassospira sp. MA62]|nr:hypothetical protein [Thalassospira sp. MA62]